MNKYPNPILKKFCISSVVLYTCVDAQFLIKNESNVSKNSTHKSGAMAEVDMYATAKTEELSANDKFPDTAEVNFKTLATKHALGIKAHAALW